VSRPFDHIDVAHSSVVAEEVQLPRLGPGGWLRWVWRQLTSMRTALFLLLLLALAAIPGSLVPQRTSDPNGVAQYFKANPTLAPVLDKLQAFDAYSSVWFSSIYLLLFLSLIGCVIPRTIHHVRVLRAKPPATPSRLARLSGFTAQVIPAGTTDPSGDPITVPSAVAAARKVLRRSGYRVAIFEGSRTHGSDEISVSAERGYLREAGNLLFHIALLGILIAVGIGGGFGFSGQRVVVQGQSMINTLSAYDSLNPGRFFTSGDLEPYSLTLDKFTVRYEERNPKALGTPIDYTAQVTAQRQGSTQAQKATIKVNEPLRIGGTEIYLLGNGYAPHLTVRNAHGSIAFSDWIPFLPQDTNLTSLGVLKVPDGLAKQLGMIGFFYPTQVVASSGAFVSTYPDLIHPILTFNVYTGNLGLDQGIPKSVYALDTSSLTQLTGGKTGIQSIELAPGQTQQLPEGLGSITFDRVARFASLEVHRDPAQGWVLLFAVCALAGLLMSLLIPRRRLWVKASSDASGQVHLEYAGLARGEDPNLDRVVTELKKRHVAALGLVGGDTTGPVDDEELGQLTPHPDSSLIGAGER
jgi:cytochrome c biogenesis protein